MRRVLLAMGLAGAALAASAAPYAPQEFDFSGLEIESREAYGTVEKVRPLEVFEHAIQGGSSVLLIRLDDGADMKLLHAPAGPGAALLVPGQRVRISSGPTGLRAEPASFEP